MTGTKTNERPGVRAQVKYVRTSAYKAREVLDLVRGLPVPQALEVLEFSDRAVAKVILKCLESAIANAGHDHGLPDADELLVVACFADEGPTLKRWRPRARGRATRIRKRTCHITVIVGRMSDEQLAVLRAKEAAAAASGTGPARGNRAAAEARRQRVLRSRQTKAERKAAADEHDHEDHDHEDHDHEDHDHDHETPDAGETETGAEAETGTGAEAGEEAAGKKEDES